MSCVVFRTNLVDNNLSAAIADLFVLLIWFPSKLYSLTFSTSDILTLHAEKSTGATNDIISGSVPAFIAEQHLCLAHENVCCGNFST